MPAVSIRECVLSPSAREPLRAEISPKEIEEKGSMQMPDVAKARNQGSNYGPVCVPLYQCSTETPYENIASMPIANSKGFKAKSESSILAYLPSRDGFEDLSGRIVVMICKIGDDVVHDTVEVVGTTSTAYIVKIGGIEYSVRRAIVRFITGTD